MIRFLSKHTIPGTLFNYCHVTSQILYLFLDILTVLVLSLELSFPDIFKLQQFHLLNYTF